MKIPKQECTPEFRELAVKRVKAGQTIMADSHPRKDGTLRHDCSTLSIGAVARELGLIEQTLRNWVKAAPAACLAFWLMIGIALWGIAADLGLGPVFGLHAGKNTA